MPYERITKTRSRQEESAAMVIFHVINISDLLILKAGRFLTGLKAMAGAGISPFQNSGKASGEFRQLLPIQAGLKQELLPLA